MTEIQPAPKQLAQLAVAMRDWDYEEIRTAIIACSQAGWPDDRIYREVFRLLLLKDAAPADLRQAARDPRRPVPAASEETFTAGLAALREAYEQRKPYDRPPSGQEDGEVA